MFICIIYVITNISIIFYLGIGGEESTLSDLEAKCTLLRQEIKEVIAELYTPKVSDQCDDKNEI